MSDKELLQLTIALLSSRKALAKHQALLLTNKEKRTILAKSAASSPGAPAGPGKPEFLSTIKDQNGHGS